MVNTGWQSSILSGRMENNQWLKSPSKWLQHPQGKFPCVNSWIPAETHASLHPQPTNRTNWTNWTTLLLRNSSRGARVKPRYRVETCFQHEWSTCQSTCLNKWLQAAMLPCSGCLYIVYTSGKNNAVLGRLDYRRLLFLTTQEQFTSKPCFVCVGMWHQSFVTVGNLVAIQNLAHGFSLVFLVWYSHCIIMYHHW